ncbi:hypothetical protein [Gracilibacillus orientalis]|uniref:hypothetical protein n=1 Tax=Gracilibacillus orientalis TaxID=334253 RepID=UPI0015870572|nr:hypothetical protein [Gracilibacillus orientalis]
MKKFFYFCFIMIFGFAMFVIWLLFIVPMIGLKTFIILIIVLILSFLFELFCK